MQILLSLLLELAQKVDELIQLILRLTRLNLLAILSRRYHLLHNRLNLLLGVYRASLNLPRDRLVHIVLLDNRLLLHWEQRRLL